MRTDLTPGAAKKALGQHFLFDRDLLRRIVRCGGPVEGKTVRARSIGQAIVQEAQDRGADLIVLGSSPRWRRQSRFFSPTVDYVLKKAPSEVLIVAFPQGVLEGDGGAGPESGREG